MSFLCEMRRRSMFLLWRVWREGAMGEAGTGGRCGVRKTYKGSVLMKNSFVGGSD